MTTIVDRRAAEAATGRESLETALGWRFGDRGLLEQALTHRSYCAEHAQTRSNERLEFLGDAVLGLLVTDYVFATFDLPEGELAKLRASVVNSEVLAEVAAEVGLGSALRLGRGEEATGGRAKPSILADGLEAVLGAVYLDGGWDAASALVLRLLEARIVESAAGPGGRDFKTRLQELVAQRYDELPRYRVRHEGPDHSRWFFATVHVRGEPLGDGEGRSKKQAEQAAAQAAWQRLRAAAGVDGVRPPEGSDAGAS